MTADPAGVMCCRRWSRRAGLLWLAVLAILLPPSSEQSPPPRRPLADDLADPRWRQDAARLLRCCAEDEVLVPPSDGLDERPTCRPAPDALRWRPQLRNARSRTDQRGPPDPRFTVLRTANLTCDEGSFWLDGGRPEQRFELLTSGQLYVPATDALYPAGRFCAGRMVHEAELTVVTGGEQTDTDTDTVTVTEGAIVCDISMHQKSSLLDKRRLKPTCRRDACFRKCCPRGLYMNPEQRCLPLPANNTWQPSFHTALTQPARTDSYRTMWGNANCPPLKGDKYGRVFPLQPFFTDSHQFYLQTNGSLWVPGQREMVDLSQFCVDQMLYTINGTQYYHQFAIVCFGHMTPEVASHHYVYAALLSVSAALLLVTFVVYAAIAELRNLHGRCLMSQVAALFVAFLCRIGSQTAVVYENLAFCQATGL